MSITKNFDFENWTTSSDPPDNWELVGLDASVSADPTIKFQGTYGAKVNGGTTGGYLKQSVPTYMDYTGRTLTAQCRVYASANSARIGITDGATTTWSDWNEDTGTVFKKLRVVHNMVDTGDSELTVLLEVAPGSEAVFDTARLMSWCFNDGLHFDEDAAKVDEIELTMTPYPEKFRMEALSYADFNFLLDFTCKLSLTEFLDLMPLIPDKFHDSLLLQQYIASVGQFVGAWLRYTEELQYLLDPYMVGDEYIMRLAEQIGFTLVLEEETTLAEKRRQVLQAVDWYKIKGTYHSLVYIAYLLGLDIEVKDMYTNDYTYFELADWYAGDEGTNPPGFDSSYYKSPHFGLLVYLNKVIYETSAGDPSLWIAGGFGNLMTYVERTRPANTVPHYIIYMQPETDESGTAMWVPGDIYTCTLGDWYITKPYFDQGAVEGSASEWNFDDGTYFDQSADAFIRSTNKWKLGTGNKGVMPDTSGFELENVVLSGTVDDIRIYGDRIEFEFIATSATEIQNISELGLFNEAGTVMRVACTFPNVDLEVGIDFRVRVTINR